MAEETKKTPLLAQKQTWTDVPYPSYYANIMQIGLTPFDISVLLGEVDKATAAEVVCIPRARFTVSPEQAENLIKMLAAGLTAYTAQFGKLRSTLVGTPTEIEEPVKKSAK